MKLRFSPKYFKLRTAVISFIIVTLGLSILSYNLILACMEDQASNNTEILWITIGVAAATVLCGFLTYVAWKSYDETFRAGDKKMWSVSKWKVIKRWLFDPYNSLW